ncbi:hypothetical protein J7E96_06820 [Streptomyces sp. ISL-96]|uniref:hypothetical protein n=1 Tax=Streptomyces sp. ISL-96 TaxID=2819191 RepID=UPI001BE64F63|nr:hypothetical protein [Streptomyces sp. ISL-96]MBT2488239.1 hypothetical protein [Streptomyces sp. ISL-96]
MAPAMKIRKSIPLSHEDQAHLERLRTAGTPEHEALKQVAGILLADDASEAETLHALLTAGRIAVTERVMLTGYAALAAAQDDEDAAARRAMRARSARLEG